MLVGLHEAIHEVGRAQLHEHRLPARNGSSGRCSARANLELSYLLASIAVFLQSQESAPPVWYSITRVSKKLRSFLRSIISLIQGNGFSSFGKSASRPICVARRFAM